MADQDTRVAERIPAAMRIRLKYADVDTFIQRYSVNISRGGVFIATRTPRPVGTLLRFEFQLASAEPLIRGEGQVVWVKPFDPEQPRRVHGMGVRFLRLDQESRAMVDRALQWKREHEAEVAAAEARVEPSGDTPEGADEDEAKHEAGGAAKHEAGGAAKHEAKHEAGGAAKHEAKHEAELAGSDPGSPAPVSTDADASGPAAPDVPAGTAVSGPLVESASQVSEPLRAAIMEAAAVTPDYTTQVAVAELFHSTQSQVVRAARHIVELTAAHIYYPEDRELADLLRPVRVVMPTTGRDAARLLHALLSKL